MQKYRVMLYCFFWVICLSFSPTFTLAKLNIGSGIYDITGPAANLALQGYGDLLQRVGGIHTRLFSRAFVVKDTGTGRMTAFVATDLHSISQMMKREVLRLLKKSLPGQFTEKNLMITATHTHSSPGGYSDLGLLLFPNAGFSRKNFTAVVHGIVQSIELAHSHLKPGRILFNQGKLFNASVNRGLRAYLANPEADPTEDTNKVMTVLKFEQDSGKEIGLINWFSVHPTSMSKFNHYISSDNKGYASYLFERAKGTHVPSPAESPLSPSTFVAAFANSDVGDASPEVFKPEIFQHPSPSLVNTALPFLTDFDKVRIIGTRQYLKALELYDSAQEDLLERAAAAGNVNPFDTDLPDTGLANADLDYRHTWIQMPDFAIDQKFSGTSSARLCWGALGESFLAGAPDGPSELPGYHAGHTQKDPAQPPLPLRAGLALANRTIVGQGDADDQDCHFPKPIAIATGKNSAPWTPNILPFQIIRIGSLAILGIPGELTTMAGRRLRDEILTELEPVGVKTVVIAGLANSYSMYVTTPEEYRAQEYEGASTLFGPHTLAAYRQIFSELAKAIRYDYPMTVGVMPPKKTFADFNRAAAFHYFDNLLPGSKLGQVLRQPDANYLPGDFVEVIFRAGDPSNNLQTQKTFLEIVKWNKNEWVTVANDSDPQTLFAWDPAPSITCPGCSVATIGWQIPYDVEPGIYRIRHIGNARSLVKGKIDAYVGLSDSFTVRKK